MVYHSPITEKIFQTKQYINHVDPFKTVNIIQIEKLLPEQVFCMLRLYLVRKLVIRTKIKQLGP